MTKQTTFAVPTARYNSRIRSELITYKGDGAAKAEDGEIASRTRIFGCNDCQHIWSETVCHQK